MTVYNILEFGAVADGITNNSVAIQKAVDTCTENGGGRVLVPAGEFLSGTIQLKSNVDFHLETGATLICSLNRKDISSFFEGTDEDKGWKDGCFLGGIHAENISITGAGVIYGQGDKVFYDDDADNGFYECPKNIRGFRPRMILFEDITNFVVEGVTLKDAPFWTLHMAGCRQVRIRNIQILNDVRGANNDGIDPDSCQDVIISGCIIKTGDDAIVVKTTKPMTEKYGPCQDIVINGCILSSHDSALKVGTETHGDIRNVIFSDCVVQDCSRAIGIWARDGGLIEDIHVHHLTGAVRRYADCPQREFAPRWWGKGEPIFVNATNRKGNNNFPGIIRNISFDHIYLKSESCVFLAAEEKCPIENVIIDGLELTMIKQGTQPVDVFDEQPSEHDVYEHTIPALYARHVNGLTVRNSCVKRLEPKIETWGELIEINHCKDFTVELQEK